MIKSCIKMISLSVLLFIHVKFSNSALSIYIRIYYIRTAGHRIMLGLGFVTEDKKERCHVLATHRFDRMTNFHFCV